MLFKNPMYLEMKLNLLPVSTMKKIIGPLIIKQTIYNSKRLAMNQNCTFILFPRIHNSNFIDKRNKMLTH